MSRPSRLYFCTNFTALSIKRFRLFLVSAISEKLPDHVQPPTETRTVKLGFSRLRELSAAKFSASCPKPSTITPFFRFSEGVVDSRQLPCCNFAGRNDSIFWKDIPNDLFRRCGRGRSTKRMRRGHRQNKNSEP